MIRLDDYSSSAALKIDLPSLQAADVVLHKLDVREQDDGGNLQGGDNNIIVARLKQVRAHCLAAIEVL